MARLSTKIEPIDRVVDLLLAPVLSPQERSAALAAFAAEAIAEVDASNAAIAGHEVEHETYVDGRRSDDLAAVRPDGTIVAEWSGGLQGGVIDWIWAQIELASPRLTGAYAASHRLLADGVEVSEPNRALEADEWVITPTVPYARKLEGMSGARSPLSEQAPEGVYHVVAEMAKARFGNMASIKFTARSIEGGALSDWASTTKLGHRRHASARTRRDWLSRQPAIVIRFV